MCGVAQVAQPLLASQHPQVGIFQGTVPPARGAVTLGITIVVVEMDRAKATGKIEDRDSKLPRV
jgi:hypothetical protein